MKKVTHLCMDRPVKSTDKGKEYVQPQYIIDSLNNLFLLPTKPYLPGIPAPAHLSPFVDNAGTGYVPDRQREINSLAGIETAVNAEEMSSDSDENDEKEVSDKKEEVNQDSSAVAKGDLDSSSDEEGESDIESSSVEEKKVTKAKKTKMQKQIMTKADKAAKNEKIKRDLKKEQEELGKMLMTNRQKKMYQKVEATKKKNKEATKKLLEKKKQLNSKSK